MISLRAIILGLHTVMHVTIRHVTAGTLTVIIHGMIEDTLARIAGNAVSSDILGGIVVSRLKT